MAKPADLQPWTNEPTILGEDSPELWNRWPGRQNAPSIVGIDRKRFRELVLAGRLTEYKVTDGSIRYRPEDLTALRDEFAFDETTTDPTFAVAGVQIEGMKTANDVLKLQMQFNESILKMFLGQLESMNKSMCSTIESQNKAIEFYQRERLGYLKEQGETKIQELALGIEATEKEAIENRRQLMIATLAPHIGPVLAAITDSVREGLGKEKPPAVPPTVPFVPPAEAPDSVHGEPKPKTELGTLAEKLVKSVGPQKLSLISQFLADEDSEVLDQIIGQMESAESHPSPTEESEKSS